MAFLMPFIPLIASVIGAGASIGSQAMANKGAREQAESTAPSASGMAPAGAPGGMGSVSPETFRNQSGAHWQQLLGNLGQGVEGGGLPQDIQATIDRQASLLG